MEAHICLEELMLFKLCFPKKNSYLPNLHMNRYLVPSSISIIDKVFLIDSSIRAVSMTALVLSTRTVIDKEFLPIRLSTRKLPIRYFDSIRIDKNSITFSSLI